METRVYGVFKDRRGAQQAKASLAAAGLFSASIDTLTEEAAKHLPAPAASHAVGKTVAASAVGMAAGGTLGLAAGAVLGPLGALGGAAVAGGAGAALGMALSDRMPLKDLVGKGAMVAVDCSAADEARALAILRAAGAIELSETVDWGTHEELPQLENQ